MGVDPVPTDLRALVTSIERLFVHQAREKHLSFAVSLDSGVPRFVQVDARRLRQILINLLNNALKFTPAGSISLRVSPLPGGPGERVCRVRFSVADTGVGITFAELATLFDPFTQASGGRVCFVPA